MLSRAKIQIANSAGLALPLYQLRRLWHTPNSAFLLAVLLCPCFFFPHPRLASATGGSRAVYIRPLPLHLHYCTCFGAQTCGQGGGIATSYLFINMTLRKKKRRVWQGHVRVYYMCNLNSHPNPLNIASHLCLMLCTLFLYLLPISWQHVHRHIRQLALWRHRDL